MFTHIWVPGSVFSGSLPSLFSGDPMGTGATYSPTASRVSVTSSTPSSCTKYDGTVAVSRTRRRFGLGSWEMTAVALAPVPVVR